MMAAKAQFYSLGDDPGRLRWRTFETPHYRIVYPRGLDSLALVYGNEFEKYVKAEEKEEIPPPDPRLERNLQCGRYLGPEASRHFHPPFRL